MDDIGCYLDTIAAVASRPISMSGICYAEFHPSFTPSSSNKLVAICSCVCLITHQAIRLITMNIPRAKPESTKHPSLFRMSGNMIKYQRIFQPVVGRYDQRLHGQFRPLQFGRMNICTWDARFFVQPSRSADRFTHASTVSRPCSVMHLSITCI
jgi:hypothetical protein